jgi:ribokinase
MLVTGIGQCSWDFLSVVRSYPEPDTKVEVLRLEEQGGGPVATALVSLRRLGVGCRFFGVTGDDSYGRKIKQSLVDEGVDTGGLMTRGNASSQVAFTGSWARAFSRAAASFSSTAL